MEFKKEDENLTFIEQQLSTEPHVNVLTKEEFEKRVHKVFTILWDKLSMSFGPGGAGTFISIYPNYYNTKDGFTIMKNIAFDKKLDQVICDMVMSICTRLNFTVGDGTTTAVIATKSVYDSYLYLKNSNLILNDLLPRDILDIFEKCKNMILSKLDEKSTSIRTEDPKLLREDIEKVVYISSNGNKEITNMIGDLYEQLRYPAITCTLSTDGRTRYSVVDGYKIDISLTDKIYINNDSNTMSLEGTDFIVFSHKVTKETYEKILKPLSRESEIRQRHLVCIAPYYDETALDGVIKYDLNREYKEKNDINLVLMVCSTKSAHDRVLLEDLAMLLNTEIITPEIERTLIKSMEERRYPYYVFDLDNREIPDSNIVVITKVDENHDNVLKLTKYSKTLKYSILGSSSTDLFRIGYCGKSNLGLKESTLSEFFYNENKYKKFISTAKAELEEIRRKCEKVGSFSKELNQKQQRLYSLGLKTGIIEVGASSELSQGYLRDTMIDSIKAAASAYNNGTVLGCNVTLLGVIRELLFTDTSVKTSDTESVLLLLYEGFKSVQKTVFKNVFENYESDILGQEGDYIFLPVSNKYKVYFQKDIFYYDKNLYETISEYSIKSNSVFDVTTGKFTKDIINSTETDKEILKATIDLLSLLITGNQLVLR